MKIQQMLLSVVMVFIFSSLACAQSDVVNLDSIVVTASRLAQNDYKLASNVTVIDEDMIETSTANTVSEILAQQSGVSFFDKSTTKTATVDIRGFADAAVSNVLVLVNDRRVNPIDISGPDLLQIPLDSVKRIEIIHGAGTVLYGDNAVGGVINIITKEGKGKLSGKIGGTYGSYDARSTHAEISGSTKHISYYAYSQYDDKQGYRQNSDVLSKDFNSRLSTQLSEKLKLSLDTTWHEDAYGLPGGLTEAQLSQLNRRASVELSNHASTKDRSIQATLDVKPWPEDLEWGHFVLDTSFRDRDTYAIFYYTGGNSGTKNAINTLGVTGKYIFDQTILDHQVNLVTGVDYYKTDHSILGSGDSTDNIIISKEEIGAYLSSEFEIWNHLFLTGGGRYAKTDYAFDQNNLGAPSYTKQSPDKNAGMVGAKYDYAKGSNVFFNVQQTYRFLATDEWYSTYSGLNTSLKQQTGVQYEAGVKHNFDDKVTVNITPYVIKLRNEIFFDPLAGNFGLGSNNNYDRTLRRGIEFGQTTDLLKFVHPDFMNQWKFYTNYTYLDASFDGGTYDNNRVPMVPKYQTNMGMTVGVFDRWEFSLIGRYVGSRFVINDTANATAPIKPYATMDGKIAYNKDPFEIYLAINNMLDEQYYSYVSKSTSSTTRAYYPAPERNFTMGVNVKF